MPARERRGAARERAPVAEVVPLAAPRPSRSPVARVRRGVDAQLAAQRRRGQLTDVDDGLISLVRTLADVVDAEVLDGASSRYTVGVLVGKLAPLLRDLRGEQHDQGDDDDPELAALVEALRDGGRR